jgi:tetratricopeptide (TPR) repeat protein
MRRFVPRALLMATIAATASACASAGGGAGVALGGDTGGRYLVMIPALEGPGGDRVANELRALVAEMPTHVSIADREVRAKMREFELQELDEITARQLAQQIRAELVSWGSLREGGEGLVADMKFIDTRSGDQIDVTGASGATPRDLAAAIFADFSEAVDGFRQAAFCNDYLSSNQYEQALQTCDAALAIVPNNTTAQYGRATALLNLDRTEEALEQYGRLLEIDPAHQDALLGAGFAASRLEQTQRAMGYYNRYLEVNPGNVQVRMAVANDIAQTGDYVSAFRVLETAIAENQDDQDFQRYLFAIATAAGQRAQERGDAPEAQQIFGTALAAYQAGYSNGGELDASALRQAIAVNNALGRSDEAMRLSREGTQRFPDDQQMWSQLATVAAQSGQHRDAVDALTRLIQLNPQHENAHIRRAQAYIQLGQRQPALADLRAAAQRDPNNAAQVILGIGGQAIQAGNFSEAVDILTPALEFAPAAQRGQISFFVGFSLFQQGSAIARANTQGRAPEAERALALFRRVPQFVQGSGHAQAQEVLTATQQFIENQEAILRAARR